MVGRFLSHLKRDVRGRVDEANVAQDGRHPWWAIVKAGGEAESGGGGLLANTGLNRVGTHLKGPVTVLLVLVGHSDGARQAGRERGRWGTGNAMVVMRKRL